MWWRQLKDAIAAIRLQSTSRLIHASVGHVSLFRDMVPIRNKWAGHSGTPSTERFVG